MKVGNERQFRWLEGIIAAVFILNVIDGILTIVWVSTRRAVEANPLLVNVLGINPVLFIIVKMLLVGLGSYLLWRHRKRGVAVIGIFVAFIAYYWVLTVHLRGMNIDLIARLFGD